MALGLSRLTGPPQSSDANIPLLLKIVCLMLAYSHAVRMLINQLEHLLLLFALTLRLPVEHWRLTEDLAILQEAVFIIFVLFWLTDI